MLFDNPVFIENTKLPTDQRHCQVVVLTEQDGQHKPGMYVWNATSNTWMTGSGGVDSGAALPTATAPKVFLLTAKDGSNKPGLYVCVTDGTWERSGSEISPDGGLEEAPTGLKVAQAVARYDVTGNVVGKPASAATVATIILLQPFYVQPNLEGSFAETLVKATANAEFIFQHIKDGTTTEIGKMKFSPSSNFATFTSENTDILKLPAPCRVVVKAPAVADASLADFAFGLAIALVPK